MTRENVVYRGIPQAAFVGLLGFMFTGLMQAKGMVPGGIHFTLLGAAGGAFIGWGINRVLLSSGEKAAGSIYAPSGKTTAYTPTFSHIEALEVRGDIEGATRAWGEVMAEHPTNALVRVRVADFHLRTRKDARRAAVHYRDARELGTANEDLRRYIGQKLADLYLGPLRERGKGMVELRRMIEDFPGSREAEGARAALASLKAEMRDEGNRDSRFDD